MSAEGEGKLLLWVNWWELQLAVLLQGYCFCTCTWQVDQLFCSSVLTSMNPEWVRFPIAAKSLCAEAGELHIPLRSVGFGFVLDLRNLPYACCGPRSQAGVRITGCGSWGPILFISLCKQHGWEVGGLEQLIWATWRWKHLCDSLPHSCHAVGTTLSVCDAEKTANGCILVSSYLSVTLSNW